MERSGLPAPAFLRVQFFSSAEVGRRESKEGSVDLEEASACVSVPPRLHPNRDADERDKGGSASRQDAADSLLRLLLLHFISSPSPLQDRGIRSYD